jgi:hypothetical protein
MTGYPLLLVDYPAVIVMTLLIGNGDRTWHNAAVADDSQSILPLR